MSLKQNSKSSISSFQESVIKEFLKSELKKYQITKDKITIAAIGTVAKSAVQSPLLHDSFKAAHIIVEGYQAFENDLALLRNTQWSLSLVLSPYKQSIKQRCQQLTSTASKTGVVDTLIRPKDQVIGVNTNAYAAGAAVKSLFREENPERVLIAGTGASARSVLVGILKVFPNIQVGIIGRSVEKAKKVIDDIGFGVLVKELKNFHAELIVNATTVGQTDDSESMGFNLQDSFSPGVHFFDLNNRITALQTTALSRGCVVTSGVQMQIMTNRLRAALVAKN